MNPATGSRLQGRADIVIEAPIAILWQLISDSRELENWGPPVQGVEVLSDDAGSEGLGSRRKVDAQFGRRSGYFIEHRVEHIEERKVGILIDEDTFGLSKVILRPGSSLELTPIEGAATRVTFSFFHDPAGFKGRMMSPMVKFQQRRNRLAALRSLKRCAEERLRRASS